MDLVAGRGGSGTGDGERTSPPQGGGAGGGVGSQRRDCNGGMRRDREAPTLRNGFSLAELVVVMLILTMGVLGMGASTGYMLGQFREAELRAERMTAVRQTAETLRGTDWDALEGACAGGPVRVGQFSVACRVSRGAGSKEVQIVSLGPEYSGGRIVARVDTVAIRFPEPMAGT